MGSGFLSYALLIEMILILLAWAGFLHWRLSKKKQELAASQEVDIPEPFEVYLQFINRELSETHSHLDKLQEEASDEESITMYQYRLKHLDAEQKAMAEAKGDTVKFWELYRSNIDFVHQVEAEDETVEVTEEQPSEPEEEIQETVSMQEQLDTYGESSKKIIEKSNDVIELIKTFSDKNGSEELQHIVDLLTKERDQLSHQLDQMEQEYLAMMKNIEANVKHSATDSGAQTDDVPVAVSQIRRDEEVVDMSTVLTKQNSRISELNDVVGNLSLELEEKKALMAETEWVTRQLKETEHVVIILEDENNFLRGQIAQLLEMQKAGAAEVAADTDTSDDASPADEAEQPAE